MTVERKYERDVDILLAEEFSVSHEFAKWFLSKTKFAGLPGNVTDVFVSKSNNLGESDLVVLYSVKGTRIALLIENKLDAPIQPKQAERYRQRAEREIAQGVFEDYEIVFCSPKDYRGLNIDTFGRRISYEEIAHFIEDIDKSARGKYRAEFIEKACLRSSNKWVREQDDATDKFWDSVYALASKEFPILEMKALRLTKNSTWTTFRPRYFPTQPKHTCIYMKGNVGPVGRKRCFVDLTFGNTEAHSFSRVVGILLTQEMTIHQTNKATAIRIELPAFSVEEGIEAALPKVRSGLEAAVRMIEFYRVNREALDEAASSATPLERLGVRSATRS